MRHFTEPTCKNLLRPALVLGVQASGLMALAFLVLGLTVILGGTGKANLIAGIIAILGYSTLRILQRFARPGFEQTVLFWIEQKMTRLPL